MQVLPESHLMQKVLRRHGVDCKLFALHLAFPLRQVSSQLKEPSSTKGMDPSHFDYPLPPPWAQTMIKISVMNLTKRKN